MSTTELEAIIADFNKLPPTTYQVPKHTPKLLKQQRISRCLNPLAFNVSACAYILSWATSSRCLTRHWVNNVIGILAIFGFCLLPRTAGETELPLTSATVLHSSGPQVSTFQIHTNANVNAAHNHSDAPASFIYTWDANLLAATFVWLSHMFVMICLKMPWHISRKQSRSDMTFLPIKHPWNIKDSCSLLMTSCNPASDTCTTPP